jgi:hypothetical protein
VSVNHATTVPTSAFATMFASYTQLLSPEPRAMALLGVRSPGGGEVHRLRVLVVFLDHCCPSSDDGVEILAQVPSRRTA